MNHVSDFILSPVGDVSDRFTEISELSSCGFNQSHDNPLHIFTSFYEWCIYFKLCKDTLFYWNPIGSKRFNFQFPSFLVWKECWTIAISGLKMIVMAIVQLIYLSSKQIVQCYYLLKITTILIIFQSISGNERRMDCFLFRYMLCQWVLAMHQDRVVWLANREFLIVEFHLTHIDNVVFSIYQHINL